MASVLAAQQEEGVSANAMLRLGLAVFFTMNVMVFTMALWSEDVYPAKSFDNPLAETLRSVFRWGSLVFSLPVLYLLGGPIALGVWQSLKRRILTTDLLILAGVIAAYCYSIVSVLRGAGHVYFEVGAMVMVFVSIGRWLEAKGKHRAGTSLDRLIQLLPEKARRQQAAGQFRRSADAKHSARAISCAILPGERFPVDGLITRGQAMVDEQIVTGESVQATKTVGDTVYSGTLNLDGDLWIEVTATDGQETLSRIIDMVRAARSVKGRHERLADRIALVFIPLVCVIALAAGWWHYQHGGLNKGILTSLSVVLIACPCALGMATPMAIWAALGRAAQGGLLFRSGVVLERLAGIRFACFDKTGTLTTGCPTVADFHIADPAERQAVLEIANTLASGSSHLLSQAIVAFAAREGCGQPLPSAPVEIAPGQGVTCEVEGIGEVYLGSRRYLVEQGFSLPPDFADHAARSILQQEVCIGWSGAIKGVFLFTETLRPETAQALADCRQLGLEMHLLSGDHQQRAIPLGEQFGINSAGNLLPEDKAETLESLKALGSVAMVGDGLNDAPALATADVGVALGCGADVSARCRRCVLAFQRSAAVPVVRGTGSADCANRQTESVLGVRLQHHRDWARRVRTFEPDTRRVGDGVEQRVCNFQLAETESLSRAGCRMCLRPIYAAEQQSDSHPHGEVTSARTCGSRAMIELPYILVGGLLGSAHCLGMCGPLAISLSRRRSLRDEHRTPAVDFQLWPRLHLLFLWCDRRFWWGVDHRAGRWICTVASGARGVCGCAAHRDGAGHRGRAAEPDATYSQRPAMWCGFVAQDVSLRTGRVGTTASRCVYRLHSLRVGLRVSREGCKHRHDLARPTDDARFRTRHRATHGDGWLQRAILVGNRPGQALSRGRVVHRGDGFDFGRPRCCPLSGPLK